MVDSGSGACVPGGKAAQCPTGSWCEPVTACSPTTGTCKPKPTLTNAVSPVCGCDNITYFNASLAAAANVGTKTSGICPTATALKCDENEKCPSGAVCNLNHANVACLDQQVDHTCWFIPSNCNPNDPKSFRSCDSGGGQCITACNALKNEKNFYQPTSGCN